MIKVVKKWREFSKEDRLKIPHKYFNIDEKTIQEIRNIQDTKKKLIEAARLQYETFGDIHSYLTTWIAGCGSDAIIRQKFGSTQKLFDLFFEQIKFVKGIKPSWQDIKRRINIPKEMTNELAEETGIHIGDGNLYAINNKGKFTNFAYSIAGDLTNDYLYHKEYIKELMKKLYNIEGTSLQRKEKNCIESRYKSKAILEFKNKILKLPIGSKKEIRIPKMILGDKEFEKRCVVGIIDTDFCITSNISISGKMNNLLVTKEISKILTLNKIKHIYKEYSNYARFYIPKKETEIIINEWKLNNQKHLSKYNLFKEFKKFIPFSTTTERLGVLLGQLEINKLESICLKRVSSKL